MGSRSTAIITRRGVLNAANTTGVAVSFGGQLFAMAGLHPTVQILDDPRERSAMIDEAWRRFRPYPIVGLGLVGATTAVQVATRWDHEAPGERAVDILRLACIGGWLGSVLANHYLFSKPIFDDHHPIETATRPAIETPPAVARAQRGLAVGEKVDLAFKTGLLVASALLAVGRKTEAKRPSRFGATPLRRVR
ncbi:MAG: hypothetical protein M3Q10_19780 [Chloroflexota bacterium]|nr:hypothetical protein [Chloroflexota bacterium]